VYYGHDGMGTGGWVLMSLVLLLFVIVIAGFVIWTMSVRGERDGRNPPKGGTAETPLGILQHRLARGEIDEASYERLRARLTEPTPPSG